MGPPVASPDGRSVAFAAQDVIPGPPYTGPARSSVRVLSLIAGTLGRQFAFFRAIPDPDYFDQDTTYLFGVHRCRGRARRVSREVMAVPDDMPPIGLDWQAIR